MNTTFRAGWLMAAWFCTLSSLLAQTSVQENLSRADKQFDLYAYNLALRTYEQVLKEQPNNAHALARTGDCYFQLNRPEEALSWYDKAVIRQDVEPEALLRYGKALMQTGDYVGARKWFMFYAEGNPTVGQHYAKMCDFALQASQKDPLFQSLNEPLNTEAADYGPVYFSDKIVYNSARTDIKRKTSAKTSADWTGSAYNQLFVTQRNPGDNYLQAPAFLHGDLQNDFNEGPVSFSADGRRVAFCRNNFIDGTRQIAEKGVNMSLYFADVANGNWANEKAFLFNGSNYATGFPALSPDGNTLYFASNQEGGFGGWDLYVSLWNGANWTTPRNLGNAVNTPGNEVTPFFDGNNLYFSSDWHPGLGGLDVFRADVQDNNLRNVAHLGSGINSSRDDYGFIFNAKNGTGYLTSNRSGGRGNEDIWQIRKRVDEFVITVVDQQQITVPAADIDFSACNAGVKQTDAFGRYSFAVAAGKADCRVTVRKGGYRSVVVPIQSAGEKNLTAVLVPEYGTVANTPPATTPSNALTYSPASTNPNAALPDLESNTAPLTYSTGSEYPVQSGSLEKYTVYVRDENGRALPDAELNLTTCGLGSIYTDGIGRASFYFPKGNSCNMVVRKSGLEDITIPVTPQTSKEMSVAMSSDKRTKFSGLAMNAATRKTLQGVVVTAKSRSGDHETLASSNASGQYTLMLRAYQIYDIAYHKDGFTDYVSTLQTERALQADMELSPVALEPQSGNANLSAPVTYSSPSNSGMISLADLEEASAPQPVTQPVATTKTAATKTAATKASSTKTAATKSSGYAVQLAAHPEKFTESKTKKYDGYLSLGNLYAVEEGKMNKLRLGVYPTREEANEVLKEVSKTSKDAFVVWETQADESLVTSYKANDQNYAAKGLTATPAAANKTALPANVSTPIRFAVQVASWPSERRVLVSDYTNLNNLGNVYIHQENDRMRVRVGTWDAYEKAESAQKQAVSLGYKDAIIVTEKVEDITNERLRTAPPATGSNSQTPKGLTATPAQYSAPSLAVPVPANTTPAANPTASSNAKYYIRVCAMEDTQNFDPKKLDGSGAVIEKWPIGDTKMTAVMLTGFPTVEQAMTTTDKLRTKGFTDAYIIKDENGRMSKFRY